MANPVESQMCVQAPEARFGSKLAAMAGFRRQCCFSTGKKPGLVALVRLPG